MAALPQRMRERIFALYEQGIPTKRIAETLGVCRSGARRIRQQAAERGTLEPLPPSGGYASGLTEDVATRLRALVAVEPGLTRQQMKNRLGVGVDVRTVGRWLRKLGLVLKKSRSSLPNGSGPTSKNAATPGTNR